MASGGSFSNSIVSGHYKLKVDWSQAQDVSANTSTVTCKMYLINDWSIGIGSRANTHKRELKQEALVKLQYGILHFDYSAIASVVTGSVYILHL